MAGRIRTQLRTMERVQAAAESLYDALTDATPPGLLTVETAALHALGELADGEANDWLDHIGAAIEIIEFAEGRAEALRVRVAQSDARNAGRVHNALRNATV
ncbi:MAG: hypothetical protein IT450_02215 [Phycisphaerales bacterium]|nr:hypothetical protein [Phycisphaerales bacterium]